MDPGEQESDDLGSGVTSFADDSFEGLPPGRRQQLEDEAITLVTNSVPNDTGENPGEDNLAGREESSSGSAAAITLEEEEEGEGDEAGEGREPSQSAIEQEVSSELSGLQLTGSDSTTITEVTSRDDFGPSPAPGNGETEAERETRGSVFENLTQEELKKRMKQSSLDQREFRNFSKWIICFCVVAFDIEIGQGGAAPLLPHTHTSLCVCGVG